LSESPLRRHWLRRAVLGAGVVAACVSAGRPAQAQSRLAAHYTLSLAGLGIGEGDWAVDIGKERYSTQSNGRFFGAWRAMFGSEIAASARGVASASHLAPTNYTANFSWDDEVEDVQMTFRNGMVSVFETRPPAPSGGDRIAVTAAHLRGAVDPLTAGLASVPGSGDVLAPTACQRTLAIFDGSHRFDMALSFKRRDTVAEEGFRGPAIVCAMTYRPIAGYTPGAFRVGYLKANHDMEMWFAPIPGTRFLAIVRISIPTMLGTAVLRATRFESAGR
jgi:uncharacterized protein DUF3108